ncbi:MAG: pyruvate kinase [Lachnospiraceae bacterium]|jgi:pyruvate kinase|nr:pyruvate kinase [Lachnospiraceae bacterium]
MNTRKTKIVCTLGPSSNTEEVIRNLMIEGMDVARLNFSHGNYEDKLKIIDIVKKVRKELNKPVALLLDTKGPEVRLGVFKEHSAVLEDGKKIILTTEEIEGDASRVSVSYKALPADISVGTRILLDDGLIELQVEAIEGTEIYCNICNGGTVSDRKGINLPNVELSIPFISQKDHDDIKFGIDNGFDFIAASFVRTASDVEEIRGILKEYDCHSIDIIAKIENNQGVSNIDEIVKVADGVMVARGDMGVEIPLEEVPVIQKMIIKKVYSAGKQVITATQMLESMIKNPRPTRAEATDIANAIFDGTGAIMLSGETAAGKYPIEALKTMVRIATRTEDSIDYHTRFKGSRVLDNQNITNAISHATVTTAEDLGAAAIVTVTKSGFTAKMISKYRPSCPIMGCSTYEEVCRRLNLVWGVIPVLIEEKTDTDELFEHAIEQTLIAGKVKVGELTVITAGLPLGISGTTNLIKVHVAGHVLVKGIGVSGNKVTASLCVCANEDDLKRNFREGDIIVIPESSNRILPYIKNSSGLITEEKNEDSHAAIVGLTLGLPVIIGASHASQILKDGAVVTMDASSGVVTSN